MIWVCIAMCGLFIATLVVLVVVAGWLMDLEDKVEDLMEDYAADQRYFSDNLDDLERQVQMVKKFL